jgi:predicted nucleic acid-binding protein
VDFAVAPEHAALARLMAKYADLPMSLADACLVRMAELHPGATIFTVDEHFRVYRQHERKQIPTILPPR